jgi:murein DD-endopeptidase MepM/ murein hydrolase activator NlpD
MINENLFDITYKYDSTYKGMVSLENLPVKNILRGISKVKIVSFMFTGRKYSLKHNYTWVIGNKYKRHDNSYIYSLPYKINTSQMVTQGFNGKFSHKGNSLYAIDFGLKIGTEIFASRGGVVVLTKNDSDGHGTTDKYIRMANFITIKHNDGTYAKYAHLKKGGVKVNIGQQIKRGEFIGYSGNTGYTNGPHLHMLVFTGKNSKSRKSIPIKFKSKNGIVDKPIRGQKYTAVQ